MVTDMDQACAIIISTTFQLIYLVRSPTVSIIIVGTQNACNSHHDCRELTSKDIANLKASNIDPSKLGQHTHACVGRLLIGFHPARVVRLLAANHIFVELAPAVFAHNRLSSCMSFWSRLVGGSSRYIALVQLSAQASYSLCLLSVTRRAPWDIFCTLQETYCDPQCPLRKLVQ